MVESVLAFFAELPRELYVLVISMLPIVELRGAVPIGAILELPFYVNLPLAVLGNLLPVPFILLFISKLLDLLGRTRAFEPMVRWLRKKAEKYSGRVLRDGAPEEGAEGETAAVVMDGRLFIALMLFVALPVPGTGAWTGSLVAALFSLPRKGSFAAIALGVLICGLIMSLASYGVLGFLSFLI